jgi:hypothetical protein
LRQYSAWIVDVLPDVAFVRKRYLERIIGTTYCVRTELVKVLCVDSRRPARCSIPTQPQRRDYERWVECVST